ncbi:MAG: EamA family transporter [Oscillospiraceae bacterium]|nr:EamA family transporter [Oscillospiraceae bacterium]
MELWFLYAAGAAVFAALTTILAKIGLKDVDSHLATAVRTVVVLIFGWLMVFIVGSQGEIWHTSGRTWIFLTLSGFAAGGSWLCYFRALQLGNVNQIVPIKKSSTILTMIFAFIFLNEPAGWLTVAGMALIGIGTWLMLDLKKSDTKATSLTWLPFAILAAVFAAITAILGNIGIAEIEANLGTAIRTMAVLPMSLLMFGIAGDKKSKISRKNWVFLILSGIATGASWLFFYRALQIGNAIHVVPVDKLSIIITMLFARLFLGERFSARSLIGLALLTAGTLIPIFL